MSKNNINYKKKTESRKNLWVLMNNTTCSCSGCTCRLELMAQSKVEIKVCPKGNCPTHSLYFGLSDALRSPLLLIRRSHCGRANLSSALFPAALKRGDDLRQPRRTSAALVAHSWAHTAVTFGEKSCSLVPKTLLCVGASWHPLRVHCAQGALRLLSAPPQDPKEGRRGGGGVDWMCTTLGGVSQSTFNRAPSHFTDTTNVLIITVWFVLLIFETDHIHLFEVFIRFTFMCSGLSQRNTVLLESGLLNKYNVHELPHHFSVKGQTVNQTEIINKILQLLSQAM